MNDVKKINDKSFFYKTRFLWAGGLLGVLQQILGHLDVYFQWDFFEFSGFMSGLGIWAMFILLFIFRKNAAPKEQFKDILIFFVGLNVFYYVYISIVYIVQLMSMKSRFPEQDIFNEILVILSDGVLDTIHYTIIGTAAAIWGFFTVKFRNGNKKVLYYLMLSPLFLVMISGLGSSAFYMVKYIIQEYKIAHNLPVPPNYQYTFPISDFIVNLVGLVITGRIFVRQCKEAKEA